MVPVVPAHNGGKAAGKRPAEADRLEIDLTETDPVRSKPLASCGRPALVYPLSRPSPTCAAGQGGWDLRKIVVLAHNRLALPRSAACVHGVGHEGALSTLSVVL
jgi:hypothetical protein